MTEAEFQRLPDEGGKWELVAGEARRTPADFLRGVLAANLMAVIGPDAKGLGLCTCGRAGFRMTNGNIRCPDFSFTRKERLPADRPLPFFGLAAPDLCAEVISPAEDGDDKSDKAREYFASGARYVWHVFPETQSVTVYASPTDAKYLSAADILAVPDLLPDFSCRVSELFAF